AARDSYRRSYLAGRRPRRGGAAGLLLPHRAGAGAAAPGALDRLSRHQLRRLRLPARPGGRHRRARDARARERFRSHRARRVRPRCPRGTEHMPVTTILTTQLALRHPIIQAPLAGGADTPALVAAVCEAGALGSIGATYMTPQQIAETCAAVRSKTSQPFGINLFVPDAPVPEGVHPEAALARVAPFFEELGLPRPEPPPMSQRDFDAQLDAALAGGASVFTFTFGMLPAAARDKAKARGLTVGGTATTVDEAIALERAGVDFVVAQGSEAGGHRGTFAGPADDAAFEAGMIGTLALVPQIVDAVRLPVIASGGIMDG